MSKLTSAGPPANLEPGAVPTGGLIPLCVPFLGGREWDYVKECLDTGWVSSAGPFVNRLEEEVAGYVQRAAGVATVSGTAALHLALQVAGVTAGDEVLVSDLTFIAPVNAVRYLGAVPVLVDAEPNFWQIDVELLKTFLEQDCEVRTEGTFNRKSGRRVAAIVPVHILGHPVDIDPVVELGSRFRIPVIEDATEALGAVYRGSKVGRQGLLSCFSFNGNKIITAGGGGLIVTDDPSLAARCRYLSTQAKDDALFYVHQEVGYNYRLTNLQAALAVAQLEQLDSFVERKRAIAKRYQNSLSRLSMIQLPGEAEWARSTYWMYTVRLMHDEAREARDQLLRTLNEQQIQSRPLWQPMHQSPAHREGQFISAGKAVSTVLADSTLSLPCSVGMTDEQVDEVCAVIAKNL